ncbi:RDD family protein [Chitinimonas koreensis]|uniref:RDD family protein n=1 Tax=Chitinimonas koreensis TaxID=356302 RepID=UPI0003FAA03A|nr:RDD family protein [Chitinimonas koreensis]QNM96330.1 RDD family protein [Chitinimonas koreensis]
MTLEHPLAPRGRRLLTLCYESLLLLAISLAGGMLFQLAWPGNGSDAVRRYVEFAYWMTLLFGYFAWCWRRSGQTLAMKTWRLRLVAEGGGAPGWRAMTIRFALALVFYGPLVPVWLWVRHNPDMKWLQWATYAWFALPWLWTWLDRERQLLHDRLAGTRVVLLPIARD